MRQKGFGLIVFILLTIGLIFIAISSISEAAYTAGNKLYFIQKQLIWSILGLSAYFIATKLQLNIIKKYANIFYYFTVLLLVILLIPNFSNLTLGARRWLDLGIIGIQPSEILKLSAIIFFSKLFSDSSKLNIKQLIIYLGIPISLIILEPNMSTAILISAVIITNYYLAGGEILSLFLLCAAGVGFGATLISTSPYRKARFDTTSYHSSQMVIAVTSGHIFGKGFANSDQKYRYLPKISTDSILAVISEETGFVGTTAIIGLYTILILKIIKISQTAKDQFQKLFTISIGCWIAFQSIINIGAVVSLIPLTGVPLPLISYGGSSLITILFGLGLIENVNHQTTNLIYSTNREKQQNNHYHRHPSHTSH